MSEAMQANWPTIRCIAKITRYREHLRGGILTKKETGITYLISSLKDPEPEGILGLNRNHWLIEIMHRDKDVTLGEDRYTNRLDHAPRNIFTLISATLTLLKKIGKSPTRAIEKVQDNRNTAISFLTNENSPHFH